MSALPWVYNGPVVTTAASPLLSPWFEAHDATQVVPFMKFVGGTTVFAIEGSWDGASADADFVYGAPVSGTPFTLLSPYFRFKATQTVADATTSKVYLRARM